MKKSLFAIAAIAALTGSQVFAADLPLKAPPPPPPTWTGCYVDGGGGYGLWNQDISLTGIVIGPGTLTTSATTTDGGRGWLGRFGGGCDYQFALPTFGNFVIGAFGDYDFMGLRGTNLPNEIVVGPGGTSPVAFNVNETSAAYAGLRLGYLPSPNLLTFASGGWTGTRFQNSGEFLTLTGAPVAGLTYPSAYNVSGWFIGSGFEYALNMPWMPIRGLFWKTEYRFAQYQQANLAETFGGVPDGNVAHNQSTVQTVTSSLVWRFNWPSF
jgi:outer membrane immunogenic protein